MLSGSKIQRFLDHWAFSVAARRFPSRLPDQYGEVNIPDLNYTLVYFFVEGEQWAHFLLLRPLEGENLLCYDLSIEERETEKIRMNSPEIAGFRISRRYGDQKYSFERSILFLISEFTFSLARRHYTNYIIQRLFNLSTPVRSNRIDILYTLAKVRLGDEIIRLSMGPVENHWISVSELLSIIHGPRIFNHPQKQKAEERLKMHLESLVESGDVEFEKEGVNRCRALGKALSTISQFEEDNRRYLASLWQFRATVFMSLIIALSGAIQALLQLNIIKPWLP